MESKLWRVKGGFERPAGKYQEPRWKQIITGRMSSSKSQKTKLKNDNTNKDNDLFSVSHNPRSSAGKHHIRSQWWSAQTQVFMKFHEVQSPT